MEVESLKPGESGLVVADGQEVALFNVEGRLYAIGNRCPHRSGPLFRGRIETVPDPETGSATTAVRCPIHGWLFELATGRCLTRPRAGVPVYSVTCQDGELCVGK